MPPTRSTSTSSTAPRSSRRSSGGRPTRGCTARLAAGFCWPWSDPRPDGTLVSDVKLGGWSMPWNAKPDAGRLAAGVPQVELLGQRPRRDRAGRLHLHGARVRVRPRRSDLGPRPRLPQPEGWVAQPEYSKDNVVRRGASPAAFPALVKNTYRVLLTRGLRGATCTSRTTRPPTSSAAGSTGQSAPRQRNHRRRISRGPGRSHSAASFGPLAEGPPRGPRWRPPPASRNSERWGGGSLN